MRRVRFHISALLAAVLIVGVAFAALRESNDIWDGVVFTLTAAILLSSVLLTIHRSEKRRAYWFGFALFGLAYMALSLAASTESRLITTKALAFIDSKLPRTVPAGLAYFDYDNDGTMDVSVANNSQPNAVYVSNGKGTFHDVTTTIALDSGTNDIILLNNSAGLTMLGTSRNFIRIGHSLCALIVAMIGGQLSRHLYSKNQPSAPESAP
jgi:hypothetical protein